MSMVPRKGKSFKNISVYSWVPGESDLLSSLVYWLKGKDSVNIWDPFVYQIRRQLRLSVGRNLKGIKLIVVPAPSGTGVANHSMGLAKSVFNLLRAEFDAELWDVLQMEERQFDQKTLNRQARARKMICLEDLSGLQRSGIKVIFVDDVCTTGSTIESAYLALQKPANFYTVTLVSRTIS